MNVRSRRYGPFIAQTPEDDASARAGREHRLRRAREVLWEADWLFDDKTAVDYGYDASDAILLERKDDMKRRGLASPDDGDALALTFAYPVAKREWAEERRFEEGLKRLRRWIR